MNECHVDVERDGRFWFVTVDGIGHSTQARNLAEVEPMARDLISVMTDVPADSFTLDIGIHIPEAIQERLRRTAELRSESARLQSEAAAESRLAARALADEGLTLRDIGTTLGISYQRAAQLVSGAT